MVRYLEYLSSKQNGEDRGTKNKTKDISTLKKLLRSRLFILTAVLLLVLAGVSIVNRSTQDPAAEFPRQLADQLLQGWQSCNFDEHMRAKQHAIYKDIKEKVESGPDRQEFDETCGKIQVLGLVKTEKSKKTDSTGTVGYRFDYKLKQSMSNQWNETVVLPLIVTGDEKDGYLISMLTFVNEEDYNRAQSKKEL